MRRSTLHDRVGMIELLVVSVIWSFAFGLIGHFLRGLDPNFVAFTRMARP